MPFSNLMKTRRKGCVNYLLLKKRDLIAVLAKHRLTLNLHKILKIIKQMILLVIIAHVKSLSINNQFQSAYRCGYSTNKVLTHLLKDVFINAYQKSRTLLLQLGVLAAFDTIDQETLISKLEINVSSLSIHGGRVANALACNAGDDEFVSQLWRYFRDSLLLFVYSPTQRDINWSVWYSRNLM